jgi:hypothetical protein
VLHAPATTGNSRPGLPWPGRCRLCSPALQKLQYPSQVAVQVDVEATIPVVRGQRDPLDLVRVTSAAAALIPDDLLP